MFLDVEPVERKIANEFYLRLRESVKDWHNKFGTDKNGKVTKFKEGYAKAFD